MEGHHDVGIVRQTAVCRTGISQGELSLANAWSFGYVQNNQGRIIDVAARSLDSRKNIVAFVEPNLQDPGLTAQTSGRCPEPGVVFNNETMH
jgi:hypothetical protein